MDDARTRREITQYRLAIAAGLAAQDEPDDKLAVGALLQAPDPAPFYGRPPAGAAQPADAAQQ